MFRSRFVKSSVMIVTAIFATLSTLAGTPTGTAITYQGVLQQSGAPANGTFHLRFQLWDSLIGGAQVGTNVDHPAVNVVDGLFTADLDFGLLAFNGSARWLQVQVVTGGGGTQTVTTLVPRQPIHAVPYALFALASDGTGLTNLNASNLVTGTIAPARMPTGGAWSLGSTLNIDSNTFTIDPANNRVGFGTAAPLSLLHAVGDAAALRLQDDSDLSSFTLLEAFQPGQMRLNNLASTGASLIDINPQSLPGTQNAHVRFFRETNTTGIKSVIFHSGNNTTATSAVIGVAGSSSSFQLDGGGLGIGTPTPAVSLHVLKQGPVMVLQDTASNANQAGYVGFWNSSGTETGWMGYGTPGSPHMWMFNGRAGGHISLLPSGNVGIGTTAPTAKLHVVGTTRTTVLEITGADLAEKFPVSEPIEPGLVVSIDRNNAGQLCLSNAAYDRAVAGIVSGANDFAAGAVLGNLPGHEDSPAIALTGRVYVWCDADELPIDIGDFLTTSDVPGHAMKAADLVRGQGAIIGKAMTPLAGGRGLVLVLVNLQ